MATQVRGYLAYTEALEIMGRSSAKFDFQQLLAKRKNAQIKAIQDRSCQVQIPNTNMEKCMDSKVPFGFLDRGKELKITCKNAHEYPIIPTFQCTEKVVGN